MKALLTFASSVLVSAAFLDAIFQWGLGKPVPILRDSALFLGGVVLFYVLVRYRKSLK